VVLLVSAGGSERLFDGPAKSVLEEIRVKKIYVGNLPFSATEDEITELFSKHGTVHSVALITDRDTGRPRGFGFIEMDDSAAQAAIQALNGYEMDGRDLKVNEAQDRPKRGGGGFGGGGGGGRRGRR
jgi:RNA recognition motif-containing protein